MKEKLISELVYMTHGVQIISLIGSLLVLSSFLCRGERNIRLVNIIGSVFCVIYSIFTMQWSNLILNAILIGVNGYHLIKDKE